MSKIKNKYDKTLDEYIEISKGDITLYFILSLIVIAINIAIIIYNKIYNESILFFVILCIIPLLITLKKITVKHNLLKIKKYLTDNQLIDKIGTIEFYNEEDYFLTEKYMIIYRNKVVSHFEYSEIKCIQKEHKHTIGKNSKSQSYLYIILNNGTEYRVLISSTVMVNEDYKDISDNLLKKNPNIVVEEEASNIKWDLFRFK